MSAAVMFGDWLRPVWWRVRVQVAALGLPLVLAAAAVGWRLAGPVVAAGVLLVGVAGLVVWAVQAGRRYDVRWLLRQLDAAVPALEDSSDLLLADEAALGPLQRLQRGRVMTRLGGAAVELRPDWAWRRVALAWGLGVLVVAGAALWPRPGETLAGALAQAVGAEAGPPVLVRAALRVAPPGYTGLPARAADGLSAKAPVGSVLTWRMRFVPQADAAALEFLDGRRLALRRDGEDFVGSAVLDRSALYRVVAAGEAKRGGLHRLDAVADAVPVVRVVTPEQTLTVAGAGMRRWALLFEARDDHGVAMTARLRLIRAEGSGENVRFRESAMTLLGSGPARQRRFAGAIDLAAMGIGPGTELVAQLTVTDNRPGGGQAARSASVILRVPSAAAAEVSGLEGMVQRTMPAYFRSQRQIIIDIEALLKARRGLEAGRFLARSNAIGDDQRILRMRYGRFLGEESEGQPKAPSMADLLTSDGGAKSDAPKPKVVIPEGHDAFDGHDHSVSDRAPPVFGSESNVMADYGHAHGDSETATLFDPRTRATLAKALDAMWQVERAMRQGEPGVALPQAYVALTLIKDVQQATRIFLARTGPTLPPIDETRRLGKREGIVADVPGVKGEVRADAEVAALHAAWAVRRPSAAELAVLERWLAGATVPDRLGLVAAIDAVRSDPGCAQCVGRLRGALWGALRVPPADVARRGSVDAAGGRYLDALAGTR